jgi:glutathione synthase/RimK-type ligase-like ATP-grasp enzyme
MINVAIATCSQLPELDPDDLLFAQAVERLGARVTAAIWNDTAVDWGSSELCVVRSTWDYHRDATRFLAWVDDVGGKTALLNPPEILRWNSHKFYLRELHEAGVATVPTFWLRRGDAPDLGDLLDWLGWPEAVIKPAHGASADGVLHVRPGELGSAQVYLNSLIEQQDALVQPFLATISTYHERALVFIAGEFSHAVEKMPFMHANLDLAQRSRLPPGAAGEVPVEATADEISLGRRALEACPPGHIFARVDVVHDGVRLRVLEIEMIEPTLYFYARPAAAEELARVVVEHSSAR